MVLFLLLIGCGKSKDVPIEPTTPDQPVDTTGDESVDEVSTQITETGSLDDDLESSDLDNLESDLELIDW